MYELRETIWVSKFTHHIIWAQKYITYMHYGPYYTRHITDIDCDIFDRVVVTEPEYLRD